MEWNPEIYQEAITVWIEEYIERNKPKGERYSLMAQKLKLTTCSDGKVMRNVRQAKRKWTIIDICNIANHFHEQPSSFLMKIDLLYQTNYPRLESSLRARKQKSK